MPWGPWRSCHPTDERPAGHGLGPLHVVRGSLSWDSNPGQRHLGLVSFSLCVALPLALRVVACGWSTVWT